MCVSVCACIHSAHVEIRRQLVKVCFLFPPCEFQRWNSGLQPWQQAPIPAEPSDSPPPPSLDSPSGFSASPNEMQLPMMGPWTWEPNSDILCLQSWGHQNVGVFWEVPRVVTKECLQRTFEHAHLHMPACAHCHADLHSGNTAFPWRLSCVSLSERLSSCDSASPHFYRIFSPQLSCQSTDHIFSSLPIFFQDQLSSLSQIK